MDDTNKAVVFQVGNEEYAISVDYVISIEKAEDITPIPHMPSYVKGIMKVRGELIPIIDFENVLYTRDIVINDLTKIIVLQTEELSIGLIVGDAKEIIDIPESKVKQLGLIAYQKTNYMMGIANLDSRLITLISPFALVRSLDGVKELQEYMENQ